MSLLRRLRNALRHPASRDLEQGLALHEAGRLDEAERRYRAALARDPDSAGARHLLGVLALQRGDARGALALIGEAIGREPGVALYHFNLANCQLALGDTEAARESLRRAVALDPGHAAAWFNLGEAEFREGRHDRAIEAMRRVLELQPDSAEAAFGLARSLIASASAGQSGAEAYAEAVRLLEPSWERMAQRGEARLMLAFALQELKRWSEACRHYEAVLADDPDNERAHNNVANCYNALARREDAVRHYRELVRLSPANAHAASSVVSALNYDETATPDELFAAHRRWARRYADPAPRPASYPNVRGAGRRLRIGYVSPDFRRHVVSSIFAPVLESHDRDRFEACCYYGFPKSDDMTARLRRASDLWRDVHDLNDEQLAAQIAADRIDILVDLAGHTSYGRLLVFARKPAPVQVSWLGYFCTTGLDQITAFVTDPHSSPPGQERWFSERLERLPHTRFVFEPHEFFPEPGPLPALERGRITFGCLNNLGKLNPPVLRLWGRLLGRVPGSRLVLQSRALGDEANRARFVALCEQCGIPAGRIELRPWVPLEEAAKTYLDIDVALDPFPFCGGMTSFDALWMGVPVVTLPGPLVASRQTAALLANLGLERLVAADEEHYLDIAAGLADDLAALESLRRSLRATMAASPLLDYRGFTRELEALYRRLWVEWLDR